MKFRILGAFMLFTSLVYSQTTGNDPVFNSVDNKINDFLEHWGIPGAAVAITKDGKLFYNKGFGYSDQAMTKKAKPGDLYRIASVSKTITSIAIMKLVEQGQLFLSDKVFGKKAILDQDYYLNSISDDRVYSITVQQLLEHTAGWDRNVPSDGYSHSDPILYPLHVASVLGVPNPVSDSALIKFTLMHDLDHRPVTIYSYSNIGYLILGKVIEKISSKKYEDYVKEEIFRPLDIHDIRLGKNLLADKEEREVEYVNSSTTRSVYGNEMNVPWQYGGFNLEAMNSHGGWIASASDLTKLLTAVDGFNTSPDILKKETVELMMSPGNENIRYAKGWSVNKGNYYHTGNLMGSASFVCITKNGYTWAFLFNSRSTNSKEFWLAFDKLPWDCIKTISSVPEEKLFASEPIRSKQPIRGFTP
jgi:CubicO group peptidase (beta-lactamase class C family)